MSFPLRRDVGADVLAAFASIAVANPDAPRLPPAMPYDCGVWPLDYEPDCDMSDPWTHDWGAWLATSDTTAYIASDQGASMVWRGRRWVVTARATWKSHPEEFINNLAVLGTIIDAEQVPEYDQRAPADDVTTGFFVGYVRYEYDPRPYLLWADGSTLHAENLNPPNCESY